MLIRQCLAWSALLLLTVGCSQGDDPSQTAAVEPGANASENAAGGESQVAENGEKKPTVLKPAEAVELADKLLGSGNATQATNVLSAAIKADPKLAVAWSKRASILRQAGLHRRAISDLTQAISLDQKNAQWINERGYCALQLNDLRAAMSDFDLAIAVDSTFAPPYNNRGLVRLAVSQYSEAVTDFDAAIRHKSDYADAYNNRGFAKMMLEQYDAAVADFSQAIDVDGSYVNAWNNRGLTRLKSGEVSEAVIDFSQAISLAPTNPKYYLQRSEAYNKLGETGKAESDLKQVTWLGKLMALNKEIKSNPKLAVNFINRANHFAKAGKLNEAAADADTATNLAPKSPEALTAKARVYTFGGKLDDAKALCQQALAIAPLNETHSLLGDIKLQQGDHAGAIVEYEAAKRLDNGVARAYFLHGESLKESGAIEQASAAFERAAAIDPSYATQ